MQIKCKSSSRITSQIIDELENAPDFYRCKFTPEEDDIIRKFYSTKGSRVIAEKLGKTLNQVKSRANNLGVRRLR